MIYKIVHLAAEGHGVRATARALGVSNPTVIQVIHKVSEHCQKVLTGLMNSLQLTEAQMDELWTFVKKNGF
jgi:transposase-like protein